MFRRSDNLQIFKYSDIRMLRYSDIQNGRVCCKREALRPVLSRVLRKPAFQFIVSYYRGTYTYVVEMSRCSDILKCRHIDFRYSENQIFRCSGIQTCRYSDIQTFSYADNQIFKYSDIKISRYSDIQLFRYADMQTFEYSDIRIFRHSDTQTVRYSDIQIFRHSDIQTFRSSDIQICRHSDIQISIFFINSLLMSKMFRRCSLNFGYDFDGYGFDIFPLICFH
jgi:hypothetical protein